MVRALAATVSTALLCPRSLCINSISTTTMPQPCCERTAAARPFQHALFINSRARINHHPGATVFGIDVYQRRDAWAATSGNVTVTLTQKCPQILCTFSATSSVKLATISYDTSVSAIPTALYQKSTGKAAREASTAPRTWPCRSKYTSAAICGRSTS